MPHARVLFDSHGYRDGDATRHAAKGDVIEVSADELERGIALGSLEKATAKDASDAEKAKKTEVVAEPGEPTTPSGAPAGDGKHDVDA